MTPQNTKKIRFPSPQNFDVKLYISSAQADNKSFTGQRSNS